jgi:large subunit ribosomal protein L3
MAGHAGPRHGTLQFWPRKRAQKSIPRVNWRPLTDKKDSVGLLGFIGYKVGMKSAYVKDDTPNSLTKNKRVIVPVTIIECPTLKIFSIRFYKNGIVVRDVLNDNIDKELKSKINLPKQTNTKALLEKAEKESGFDDVRVLIYSQVKKTGIKKTPDVAEIGVSGADKNVKLGFIKDSLAKEISVSEVFGPDVKVIDIRGITIGKGTQGAVKRFGLSLRSHKSEKGVRGAGSIGPWHPSRLTFRVPFAGQMGFFNRVVYNASIIKSGKIKEEDITPSSGFHKYGKVKNDYLILRGSVQGPSKRQLLITHALRPTKKQLKKQFELIELR